MVIPPCVLKYTEFPITVELLIASIPTPVFPVTRLFSMTEPGAKMPSAPFPRAVLPRTLEPLPTAVRYGQDVLLPQRSAQVDPPDTCGLAFPCCCWSARCPEPPRPPAESDPSFRWPLSDADVRHAPETLPRSNSFVPLLAVLSAHDRAKLTRSRVPFWSPFSVRSSRNRDSSAYVPAAMHRSTIQDPTRSPLSRCRRKSRARPTSPRPAGFRDLPSSAPCRCGSGCARCPSRRRRHWAGNPGWGRR